MAVTRGTPTTPGIANNPVVPLPATVTTDGVLLMRVSNTNNGSATVNTPAGWTYIDNQHDAANASHYLFWKPADASDSGGSVTVTTSDATKAYRYQVVQLYGADRTNPFPHVLGGAMGAAATSLTTGALTIHGTNPSGTKYLLAMMQAGGFFSYSAHAANGFTSPTVDEFADTQGSLAALISAATSTATSTFSVTMSGSNRAVWTIMDVAEATTGVTGVAASTVAAFTQSAAGTRTIPARTGAGAASLAALTQSGAGTRTVPTSTGSAASTLSAVTQSATGTRAVPAFTASAASSLAALSQSATGTRTVPAFAGAVASTLASVTQASAGTYGEPAADGTAASPLPAFAQSAVGTFAAPARDGVAASGLPPLTQAAAGSRTTPGFTGDAASLLATLTQAAAGASSLPSRSGAAASDVAAFTQSAAGTRTAPVFSGAAASTLAAVVQMAVGAAVGFRGDLTVRDAARPSLLASETTPRLTTTSRPASLTTA